MELLLFFAVLLFVDVYEGRDIRKHRSALRSEQSRKELRDARIRELEIECGITEARQEPVKAPLSPVEQFWAPVGTGERYSPLKARGAIRRPRVGSDHLNT